MNVKKATKYFVGLTLLNKVDQLADGERGEKWFLRYYFIVDRAERQQQITYDTVSKNANDFRLEVETSKPMLDTQLLNEQW